VSTLESAEMGGKLVAWFSEHRRDLPWRRDPSPYAVWISEIMLQQTQVAKVVPYFERWMDRLPDPRTVARAEESDLLLLWEGLGYYSRVRNIQRAALKIVEDHAGEVPRDEKALLALPGIGPYTAAAILSLAFNEDVVVLDGNAERVTARVLDLDLPVKGAAGRKALRHALTAWLPSGRAREYNQAVMELGAVVCTPARPACGSCPLSPACRARIKGTIDQRPVTARRPRTLFVEAAAAVLFDDKDRVFIQKRPTGGLMAGLWEFPWGPLGDSESPREAVRRMLLEDLGVRGEVRGKAAEIQHAYTRYRVRLRAFRCLLDPPGQQATPRTAVEGRWVFREGLHEFAFPSAHRRLARMLAET